MLKKVRLQIKTERHEATGTLYDESGVEITPAGDLPDSEIEQIELTLEGSYLDDGTRVSISYRENESTGMEGAKTTISYQKNEPDVISMMRTGSVKTLMIFEKGKRHHSVYRTPVMLFELCVLTRSVTNALEREGTLLLDYTVELRGAEAEHTRLSLRLLPA